MLLFIPRPDYTRLEKKKGGILQLIRLKYSIGKTLLFDNLTAQFAQGRIIGLIGKNAAGKSTLLKILAGLLAPHQGQVIFQDCNLHHDRKFQSQIAYVPSSPFLFPFLTLEENLSWVARLRQAPHTQIKSLSEKFELATFSDCLYSKLSEGLKKRLDLVTAFLNEPKLIVLDEPCTGLDPKQRHFVWDHLQSLRSPDKLILISSHHPEEIAEFCDEIYSLSEGLLTRQTNRKVIKDTALEREILA
jgi:ABC-type multidrug transport system ATPase subunit